MGYGDNIMPFNRLPKSLKEQVISNRIVNGDEKTFLKKSANANLVSKEEEDNSIDYEDVEDDTGDVVGEEGDEDIEDDDNDDGLDKEGLLTPPLVQIRNRMMTEQFPQQQNQNRMMPGSLPARFRRRKMYNMPQRMPAVMANSNNVQYNQVRQRKMNANGGETPFIDWLDKFKKELFSKLDSHKRKVNTSFQNIFV